MTRTRTTAACLKSVEAESVQRMLTVSYRDYLKPRRCPATGESVFPLKMLHERNGR
jgi:hypothetical protein